MEKTTLYLTEDLQGAIKRIARRKRTSEAHVIREAIAIYVVAEETPPMPRSVGCIDDPVEPGLEARNVKKWIRENWIRQLEHEKETRWLGPPDPSER